jgi:hypothetical protein
LIVIRTNFIIISKPLSGQPENKNIVYSPKLLTLFDEQAVSWEKIDFQALTPAK